MCVTNSNVVVVVPMMASAVAVVAVTAVIIAVTAVVVAVVVVVAIVVVVVGVLEWKTKIVPTPETLDRNGSGVAMGFVHCIEVGGWHGLLGRYDHLVA